MSDPMAQRYGTHRPVRRWTTIVVAVLIAVAGLAWLAWAAWFHANPAADAAVTAFDVKSAHRVDARIELRLGDPGVHGTCLLRATAADHSVVGELNVRVEDLVAAQNKWISIRTERRATSVSVEGCRAS